ncbi:MAG: nicotinate (nicotinamide) nucleotide adenylyltransferase [Ferruginibacter sp.]
MKIGLYFGSFNPVHIGHLIIANYVVNNTELQQLWFVISPQNPFKATKSLLNEYHRLHLINASIEGENKIKASNIEFQLPKPSFTIDTLTHLKEKYPQHEFSIIMGSDSFCNLSKWKNSELILRDYPLYVYKREGFEIDNTINAQVHLLEAPLLQISSTNIRQLIKEGKSIRYMVPDIVKEDIERNGYYK